MKPQRNCRSRAEGCIPSPMFFLPFLGDILHTAMSGVHGRFQWIMTFFPKNHRYADNICLLSCRSYCVIDLGEMTLDLENEASKVGSKLNTNPHTNKIKMNENLDGPLNTFSLINLHI